MKQFLRSFLTLLMLVVWASGFAQDTETIDLTKQGFENATVVSEVTGTDVKLSFAKGENTNNAPTYYTADETVRLYVNNTLTISSTTKEIAQIVFTLVPDDKAIEPETNSFSTGSYSASTHTWTGNTNNIILTQKTNKKQFRIQKLVITFVKEGPGKTRTTLTFPETAISINGGDEASFKGQPAKLYAGKQELTDKTIKYTHTDDDIFATFDETTGAATLKSGVYGTATVTATYAGDETEEEAVASYTVTVKNPNVLKTTFDFVNNSYGYPRTGALRNGAIISNESPVTIVNTKNGTTTSSKFSDTDFRNYKNAILTINAKEGYFINKITITGSRINQLNLNSKNGTWNDGVWTGSAESVSFINSGGKPNTVCFETITIEYTAPAPLTLDENADDTNTKIEANKGKTIDVKLIRSLKAGAWNTICLPFDVTAEQIKNILKAEGMVREYADDDATAQTITFKKVEGNMKAGEPYLIKPTEDITSLAFEGVTITATEGNLQGKAYGIWGTLGKYTMKTDGTELFLNAAGKFVAPAAATNTMKGFRAYFMVPSGSSAAALNINIDGETTGINNIETNAAVNGKVYNLNGQYVGNSLNGLKKGIYVVNGKKVIK